MSAKDSAARRFESILKNFEYSLEGYRLFLDQLHDPIRASPQEELPTRTKQILDGLETTDKKSLANAFRVLAQRYNSLGTDETISDDKANGTVASPDSPAVELSANSARAFIEINRLIMRNRWTSPDAQLERLYRSVIIGLVGQFEVLVADIAHQFFRHAPGALNAEEKVLSLSDLRQFESMDEALDYFVDREIDKLLSQSVAHWAKFFDKRMKIQLRTLARDWEEFKEVIQRRHIIVHADGRISRRYLQNVSPALVDKYFRNGKIGQPTALDRDYVERALDHFEILGTLLCFTAWLKLSKRSLPHFERILEEWVYDRLRKGRWTMALAVAQEAEKNKQLSDRTRMVCRLNAWLCLKQLRRFDEVRDNVEVFDDSALDQQFKLVRLALLDREDQFFDLLEATKGAGLDAGAWREWPVFSEMRQNPRFAELAATLAPKTTASGTAAGASRAVQDEDA